MAPDLWAGKGLELKSCGLRLPCTESQRIFAESQRAQCNGRFSPISSLSYPPLLACDPRQPMNVAPLRHMRSCSCSTTPIGTCSFGTGDIATRGLSFSSPVSNWDIIAIPSSAAERETIISAKVLACRMFNGCGCWGPKHPSRRRSPVS